MVDEVEDEPPDQFRGRLSAKPSLRWPPSCRPSRLAAPSGARDARGRPDATAASPAVWPHSSLRAGQEINEQFGGWVFGEMV
jgi:hypothetical protein